MSHPQKQLRKNARIRAERRLAAKLLARATASPPEKLRVVGAPLPDNARALFDECAARQREWMKDVHAFIDRLEGNGCAERNEKAGTWHNQTISTTSRQQSRRSDRLKGK